MAVPTSAFSITLSVRMDNAPGVLGRMATEIGNIGGNIIGVNGFEAHGPTVTNEIIVYCRDEAHARKVVELTKGISGVQLIEAYDRTFKMHEGGKIEVISLAPVRDKDDLSMAYTPGVARICMAIHHRPELSFEYTIRKNTVAIVSDGTAVLGLGDIGPLGAMPVMEGKALLFKTFGGVDAFPICLDTKDPDEIIETVVRLAPTFGGVNLEDIAAPNCFYIEEELKKRVDIPIFHDDQHGTAVVTLAALVNSLKIVGKKMEDLYVVIAGVGAAGVACAKILMSAGVQNIVGCDRQGAIFEGRDNLNFAKEWFAKNSNTERKIGHHLRSDGGRRCVHRRVGPRPHHGVRYAPHGQGSDRVRHGQPRSRDPSRRSRWPAGRHGHGSQRLPQPDQQRAGVPRHLPWRARRGRDRHHREDEGGGGQGDCRFGRRRSLVAQLRGAVGVRSRRALPSRASRRRSRTDRGHLPPAGRALHVGPRLKDVPAGTLCRTTRDRHNPEAEKHVWRAFARRTNRAGQRAQQCEVGGVGRRTSASFSQHNVGLSPTLCCENEDREPDGAI